MTHSLYSEKHQKVQSYGVMKQAHLQILVVWLIVDRKSVYGKGVGSV